MNRQAEYNDYGPGFNLTGRQAAGNVSIVMTKQQYEPYSTLGKVFDDTYSNPGTFGYTGWIDRTPEA